MADLKEYNRKRDFEKTKEPSGEVKKEKGKELAYVIQCHDASRLHYDFRLEYNGTLLSWAVPKGPSYDTKERRLAVEVEDHPFEYRNFEGTIPQGEYGGGVVMIWDQGTWEPLGDVDEMLKKGDLKFNVHGERLKGRWVLVRMKPRDGEEDKNWLLIKEKDGNEDPDWKVEDYTTSVVSDRNFVEIGREFYEENGREPRLKNSGAIGINKKETRKRGTENPDGEEKTEKPKKESRSESESESGSESKPRTETRKTTSRKTAAKTGAKETATKSPVKKKSKEKSDSEEGDPQDIIERMSDTVSEKPDDTESIDLPFTSAPVMLAKLMKEVPEGDEWIYELKYDGYRIIAYKDSQGVRLLTRNGQDYTDKLKDIAEDLNSWDETGFVLDGEAVVFKDEKTDFQKLQNYMKTKKGSLTYMVFDMLCEKGKDIRTEPLIERKKRLERLLESSPSHIRYSSHSKGDGKKTFEAVCERSMEGIIAKKKNSEYTSGRHGEWVKVKCYNRQEFIITGYTKSGKRASGVSSLLLSVMEGDDLIYAGRAGTGFTEKTAKETEDMLSPIVVKNAPMKKAPKKRGEEELYFVSPDYVAEISFAEITDDGNIRQGSFKGIRKDKDAREVVLELPVSMDEKAKVENKKEVKEDKEDKEETKVEATSGESGNRTPSAASDREIRKHNRNADENEELILTSPDKKMYGNYTKKDIDDYYQKVKEKFMVMGSGRLLSLVRCPSGEHGECFYQKHLNENMPGMVTLEIDGSEDDDNEYFYLNDDIGLRSAVQYGTIEFHGWGSRVENLEKPDIMVFDLDPDEELDMDTLKDAVLKVKDVLEEAGLESFVKTSGGKGYHIVVPLKPDGDYDAVRTFSKNTALLMEKKYPDLFTSNMKKDKRKGKIYLDWVRNNRTATSVVPYSLRAREGLPVSCPITWKEFPDTDPKDITIENIEERLDKDPWKGFEDVVQSIK